MYIKPISESLLKTEFSRFSEFVLKNQNKLTPRVFSEEFINLQRGSGDFMDTFCREAEVLAGRLVESENKDFAGIVMSGLCKAAEFIPSKLEKYAQQGYELAKSNGDYVHMMARLNDLRKVYMNRPDKLYNYIQVLYKQENCLKELTNHYEKATGAYKSVIRKPASREDYKQMLAYVQTEIGKLTRKKHPNAAMKKLLSAKATFEQSGNQRSIDYIDMLLSEIQEMLSRK